MICRQQLARLGDRVEPQIGIAAIMIHIVCWFRGEQANDGNLQVGKVDDQSIVGGGARQQRAALIVRVPVRHRPRRIGQVRMTRWVVPVIDNVDGHTSGTTTTMMIGRCHGRPERR
jgi:hypothetical protein